MKEHPILFSAPMVRAILEGRKTQTRRIVKWVPYELGLNLDATSLSHGHYFTDHPESGHVLYSRDGRGCWNQRTKPLHCPYGEVGDRLWVRETFCQCTKSDGKVLYRATYNQDAICNEDENQHRWKPSIFMPRWASRILLEVTEVRVQRLKDISEEDARCEGIEWNPRDDQSPFGMEVIRFRTLWDSINGKRKGAAWNDNPWICAVSFRRITP